MDLNYESVTYNVILSNVHLPDVRFLYNSFEQLFISNASSPLLEKFNIRLTITTNL